MKIAHIMAGAVNGGAELFFERLCLAQQAAGDEVLALIRREPAREARLRAGGVAVQGFRFGGPLDLITRPRLARALRDFAPGVAVAWMTRANMHAPTGPWVLVGRLGGYYALRHYRACDHLVGNTNGIVTWLRANGWSEARSHYLPNFVNDFGTTAPAADLPDHDAAAGRPLLLGLGRLHTDKGFDLAIRALPSLPGAILAIAGEGPERTPLERLAREVGVAARVHFLGWRQDAGALLRAADIFVCSSRIEPLGNMVIEAWSASCPLVAAAADGPAELLADNTEGLLVAREDPAALAAGITALLADPARREALRQAGRTRFEHEFAATPVLEHWRTFLAAAGKE
jgi:glycosyltransferase involved in cell wall biosynthesis